MSKCPQIEIMKLKERIAELEKVAQAAMQCLCFTSTGQQMVSNTRNLAKALRATGHLKEQGE